MNVNNVNSVNIGPMLAFFSYEGPVYGKGRNWCGDRKSSREIEKYVRVSRKPVNAKKEGPFPYASVFQNPYVAVQLPSGKYVWKILMRTLRRGELFKYATKYAHEASKWNGGFEGFDIVCYSCGHVNYAGPKKGPRNDSSMRCYTCASFRG